MKRSFLVLASFRLRYRLIQTCSVAEASPKPKNPRSTWLHYFLNRSKQLKTPHPRSLPMNPKSLNRRERREQRADKEVRHQRAGSETGAPIFERMKINWMRVQP